MTLTILQTHTTPELLIEPVIAFWALSIIGLALVFSPNFMTSFYPVDDRNIGLTLILIGSIYVQLTLLDPATGLQNITSSLSQVGLFVVFVPLVRHIFDVGW